MKLDNMEKKLFQKLLAIQNEIDGFVKNAQGHNYKYVDGNQALSVIRPLMILNKLILKQEVISCKNTIIDYKTRGGEKREVLSSVHQRFTWVCCETGETDVNEFHANGMNDFDKGLGSALTYAERYFLLKYFHIPTDADDPDAHKGREQATPQKQTSSQPKAVKEPAKELPWLNDKTENHYKVVAFLKDKGTVAEVQTRYRLSTVMKAQLDLIVSQRNQKANGLQ